MQVSGSECHLSEKTARDVGGLDTSARSVHHFEMKPLLGEFFDKCLHWSVDRRRFRLQIVRRSQCAEVYLVFRKSFYPSI